MRRFTLTDSGLLIAADNTVCEADSVADVAIHVPHLSPHVITVRLPRDELIGIKVIYSSHCWCERYDEVRHGAARPLILDGGRNRVFDASRYTKSKTLPAFLENLGEHRIYITPADRNFGAYNASVMEGGVSYTVFFTLGKDRGKLAGTRHSLVLRVESAYLAPQPSLGRKVTWAAAVSAALRGRKLGFR